MKKQKLDLNPIQLIYKEVSEMFDRIEHESESISERILKMIIAIISDRNNFEDNDKLTQTDIDKGVKMIESIIEVCKLSEFNYTLTCYYHMTQLVKFLFFDEGLGDIYLNSKSLSVLPDGLPDAFERTDFLQYQKPFSTPLKTKYQKELKVLMALWENIKDGSVGLCLFKAYTEDKEALIARNGFTSLNREPLKKGIPDEAWKSLSIKKAS